jgi:hypothetical protein
MKKVKLVAVSSLVLFLFLPGILSAEEIGILPFRTTGVESYIEEAFYEFLEDELNYYNHRVVSPYEIEHYLGRRVIAYNKDYAADYGTSLGLEKVIFGSMKRLGDEYIISVTVVRSRTGEVLLIDRITLESEEHLDVYVYNLAESIEKEIYGKDVYYYYPTCRRTYTTVYIGTRYPRRVIVRRPRRSLISLRLPLININLGKPRHVVHRRPPTRKPVYRNPRKAKIVHGKPKHREPRYKKTERRKPRDKKHHRDDGGHKKGKRK